MNAYIISIGDELLSGQTINSNAAFIGNALSEIQIDVTKVTTIGDSYKDILNEFNSAFQKADLIVVTGGLGPTHDDITRKCVVDFFETDLVPNKQVLTDIKNLFSKRQREVKEIHEGQALIPKIATAIRNYRGTAPGSWIKKDNKIFVSMPGVPYEMQGMMESFVIPALSKILENADTFKEVKSLLTTGIPESQLYEKLGDIDALIGNNSKLAFLPNQFGVKIKISATGKTQDEAHNAVIEIEQKIRTLVGRYIYGINQELLEEIVAKLLRERGLTLSVAESCTGGLISSRLTNVNGSSNFFERGVITYSNAAKVEILSVNEDTIIKHGAVSLEVSRQMAEGVKAISGTDIGIAVTGIMGPTGASFNKPIGLVYIGLCDEKICTAKEFRFGDDRLINKDRTSQSALEMLRRHLLGIPYDE
jgi:nicotinamide-nucleotide amidase